MNDTTPDNIHPIFESLLDRSSKEKLLSQRAKVIWMYGLSGSGKSTLANALERRLHQEGCLTQVLDGDNIRSGLNNNLGFSDDDRTENIRRIAEVAKLFLAAGVITINSFITPRNDLREFARKVVGESDFIEVFVKCRFETCETRDVKGLYAKAKVGGVKQFTGKDSGFEEPSHDNVLIIDTDELSLEASLDKLYNHIRPQLKFPTNSQD